MFFAIIFLSLAAFGAYLFPEWSWATILATSFAVVAVMRLVLFLADRRARPAAGNDPS